MPKIIKEKIIKEIVFEGIDNIEYYDFIQEDGKLILRPKFPKCMTGVKILKCIITNSETNSIISNDKTSYRGIMVNIWKSMSKRVIMDNTTFNIKESKENGAKGYYYQKDLKFSFQSKGANETWKEIIKMVRLNQYHMDVSLQLTCGKKMNYCV